MNRKQFLGVVGGAMAAGTPPAAAQTAPEDPGRRFREQWIATLMENLQSRVDAPARTALMESCGRACARRGAIEKIAVPCQGDVQKLVDRLAGHVGKENARLDGATAYLTYTKCYCAMVAGGPPRLPDAYCDCSRGWVLEMFETVAGRPVAVELLESIRRGGDFCRFVVRL